MIMFEIVFCLYEVLYFYYIYYSLLLAALSMASALERWDIY